MCTAISANGYFHLFGRTLDFEHSYGQRVVTVPRKFRMSFLYESSPTSHSAIIGVACIQQNTPLFFDAINEHGLAAAALNFPNNAVYRHPEPSARNVGSFELIPWVLCQCETIYDAVRLLNNVNITNDSFSPSLPSSPLHWMIADRESCIVAEPVSDGLKIYENPFGVLTNSPEFPYHSTHVRDFMSLGSYPPENSLCPSVKLSHYSRGLGAVGLPGDMSSASRLVRAVFVKSHTDLPQDRNEASEVCRFFHIADTVSQPCGCVKTEEGKSVRTIYTSCANTDTLSYYFTTYGCRRIRAVTPTEECLNGSSLMTFSMDAEEDILRLL